VAPLGVRWSLVDGSGPVAAQMRKVEPGVGHARNRFGEPVPKPLAKGGSVSQTALACRGKGAKNPK
jgi:hypothetical protein